MSSESDKGGPNEPLEFKIIEFKAAGFVGYGWFHGETKLGTDKELESVLNDLGSEGWDIIQFLGAGFGTGTPLRVVLRRRAR